MWQNRETVAEKAMAEKNTSITHNDMLYHVDNKLPLLHNMAIVYPDDGSGIGNNTLQKNNAETPYGHIEGVKKDIQGVHYQKS